MVLPLYTLYTGMYTIAGTLYNIMQFSLRLDVSVMAGSMLKGMCFKGSLFSVITSQSSHFFVKKWLNYSFAFCFTSICVAV